VDKCLIYYILETVNIWNIGCYKIPICYVDVVDCYKFNKKSDITSFENNPSTARFDKT
jgi:hypothetical protein